MKSKVKIKADDFCTCTYESDIGYVIRLPKYKGAVYAITDNGKIQVSGSSTLQYSQDDWRRLNAELQLGIEYMTRVTVLGYDPIANESNKTNLPVSSYKVGGYYRDRKNRGILFLGKARFLSHGLADLNNQYGVAIFKNFTDLVGCNRLPNDNFGKVFKFVLNGYAIPNFDIRKNKPSNLVEELVVIQDFSGAVTINYDTYLGRRKFKGIVDL